MKKILFLFFLFPFVTHAATLTLSANAGEVRAGESVSVAIGVDAGEEKIVTVKAALSYPEEFLEFTSFSFEPEAFALSQPGYDSAGGGILVKTAGFPGGFVGTRLFGTAVFRAHAAGAATITVSEESLLLNAQGVNRLTETTVLTLAVAAPAAPPELAPLPQSAELTPASGTPTPSFTPATTVPEVSEQSAAVGAATRTLTPFRITLLALFVVALLGALAWRRFVRA